MSLKSTLFFLLIFPALICAGVVDHLKPAPNKGSSHSMRKIDFIYTINLDGRPEKWQSCIQQLQPFGISPYRFSAVSGWELSLETVNDLGIKFQQGMKGGFLGTSYLDETFEPIHGVIEKEGQTYFCHCMARGAMGCTLSHLSVLKDALDSGYQTIWIMEDDIAIVRDPRILSDLITKLDHLVGKGNWDVLFTDRNTINNKGKEVPASGMGKRPNFHPNSKKQYRIREQVSPDFIQIGARFGSYSMIVRRSGMEKIFNFITKYKIFFPYDMENHLAPGLKMYTVAENVVMHQQGAISDNGAPRYLENQ